MFWKIKNKIYPWENWIIDKEDNLKQYYQNIGGKKVENLWQNNREDKINLKAVYPRVMVEQWSKNERMRNYKVSFR